MSSTDAICIIEAVLNVIFSGGCSWDTHKRWRCPRWGILNVNIKLIFSVYFSDYMSFFIKRDAGAYPKVCSFVVL